jgi:hypothetical protein
MFNVKPYIKKLSFNIFFYWPWKDVNIVEEYMINNRYS